MRTHDRPPLLDALADAVATPLAERPLLSAAALAASIPLVGEVAWSAPAAFVAASLVAAAVRGDRKFARGFEIALVLLCVPVAAVLVHLPVGPRDGRAEIGMAAVAAAACLGSAPRSWRTRVAAAALLASSAAAGLRALAWTPTPRALAERAAVVSVVLLVAVADRRRLRVAGFLLAGVAAAWAAWSASADAFGRVRAVLAAADARTSILAVGELFAAAWPALAALVCGAVGHALSRPLPADADARCVVAVRRSPWAVSSALAALALLAGSTGLVQSDADAKRVFLLAALPAAVLLGALARSAPSVFEAVPPVAAASSLACLSIFAANSLDGREPFAVGGAAVPGLAVWWTCVVCWIPVEDRVVGAFRAWSWSMLVVVGCALALPDAVAELRLAAVILAPLIVQGLVAGEASSVGIVKGAAAFGLACSAAVVVQDLGRSRTVWGPGFLSGFPRRSETDGAWWPPAFALAVALAAVAARRLRSMTVVPDDHPSFDYAPPGRDGVTAAGR